MNYSAVVIPVTRADKDLDPFDTHYQPLNDIDRKNWEACKSRQTCVPPPPSMPLSPFPSKPQLEADEKRR